MRANKSPDSTRRVESEKKRQRAQVIAERLGGTPFVRLIALGNSVAMGTATELSDLDFFVVTAPNRLWTARFFLVLRAKWLGFSKRAGKLADQADFGFWVDETALDLSPIAIRDDAYLTLWLTTLIPLVDRGGVYKRLMAANKSLLQGTTRLPRPIRQGRMVLAMTDKGGGVIASIAKQSFVERILGSVLGNGIEYLLLQLQRWKVWRDTVAYRENPLTVIDRRVYPEQRRRVDVVTTPHMLKLHHLDQRVKLRNWAKVRINEHERREGARSTGVSRVGLEE